MARFEIVAQFAILYGRSAKRPMSTTRRFCGGSAAMHARLDVGLGDDQRHGLGQEFPHFGRHHDKFLAAPKQSIIRRTGAHPLARRISCQSNVGFLKSAPITERKTSFSKHICSAHELGRLPIIGRPRGQMCMREALTSCGESEFRLRSTRNHHRLLDPARSLAFNVPQTLRARNNEGRRRASW